MTDTTRAEAAVIAALLVDPTRVPIIAGELSGDEFATRRYGAAFDVMVEMARDGKRIDAVTLASSGIDVADVALAEQGTAIEEYANIIHEGAFRRSVQGHLDTVQRSIQAGSTRANIMATLSSMSQALALEASDGTVFDSDRAQTEYQRIRRERKQHGVGRSYGIPALDRFLQPAHGGDMVVVAARPSVGKTALAEHIADHWAFESNLPVMFVSIEMSLGQLMDRAVSRWGGIPNASIVRGVLTPEQEAMVDATLERRKDVNIWYADNPYATTDTVRAAAAETAIVAGGIEGIVVDYLQLLKDGGENDNQRIGRISRNLKALAREYDCPVLVLSQLNRRAEYREDPHPRLSDIRDSGAVEQDADVVLGLWRDRDFAADDSLMDIDILKNRQGPLARVAAEFDGDHVSFITEE